MKAAFLTGPRTLEVREIPEPVCPEDGLVLKIGACGVCGSDLRRWKKGPPEGVESYTPGHEIAGEIIAVGDQMTRFQVGDRLAVAPDIHCGHCWYCERGMVNLCDTLRFIGITPDIPGGFAEQMVLTHDILENGIVHKMPADMSFRLGALAEPLSSVIAAHDKAGTSLDDVVVILGAGPIGCLHIMVAKARGAQVIVSQPSEVRRAAAARFQPEALVDPFNQDLVAFVREYTGGLGASIAICANPMAATHAQAVELTRKAGRIVLFGGLARANPMTTLDGNRIHYGEQEVVGAFSYHPTKHETAVSLLHRHIFPAENLITHTFTLDDIAQAFETAASGAGLKVLVQP
ncbi:MAG: alcohol dehydrogenase catalytic domain-containing protein [Chloroflexi bacterium]|nr:alcohol dehydrogenase catalytic domain-containing protein [Chloroflexota bacterium]